MYTYQTSIAVDEEVEYPVTLQWRVPRKWRVTMQRFVLEDLRLGPQYQAADTSMDEWDQQLPVGYQLECLWSIDQSAAEDAAERTLEAEQLN